MQFEIEAVTNNFDTIDKMLEFSGVQAGICYLKSDYNTLKNNSEGAMKRIKEAIANNHASVLEHIYITVLISDCSKMFAMFMNSLQAYNTSEKSGRYTVIASEDDKLYNKWLLRLSDYYSDKKQAMENARYVLSVFNKGTIFSYTTSLRMWNIIKIYCDRYIASAKTDFELKLVPEFKELSDFISVNFLIEGFNEPTNFRCFDFVKSYIAPKTHFSEVYNTVYYMSFVGVAQLERHRTTKINICLPEENRYYVPEVLRGTTYEADWLFDLEKVDYPQALLVQVQERGTLEDFRLKCVERICGQAQAEIRKKTIKTLAGYYRSIKGTYLEEELYPIIKDGKLQPKCAITGKCKKPCKCIEDMKNEYEKQLSLYGRSIFL